ncbi:MAG: helix-turn-helix transcriptional regulator [Peptococcaceae bacterium]|nr:helix-turn-helix transcriptional regulator [Peptococcaceae bacterium]
MKKKNKQVLKLAEIRKGRGLTQMQLAAKLGVTYSCIGNYEAGLREPSIAMLKQIAYVLDVPVDELVQK